jgi:hypothetical protein
MRQDRGGADLAEKERTGGKHRDFGHGDPPLGNRAQETQMGGGAAVMIPGVKEVMVGSQGRSQKQQQRKKKPHRWLYSPVPNGRCGRPTHTYV